MYILDIIVGTRPNFAKAAPIIRAIESKKKSQFKYRLIHTGQHYDNNLSEFILQQLKT